MSVTEGGTNLTAGVREGDILAGKYRVERVLGVGGMGVVVAAHHIQLDQKVALKFLLPEALSDSAAVARFAREARAAARIKSEHVARVTDVGELENGAPYMVMEYLDGGDLSVLLKQHGAMPVGEVVDFVLQACEAIADAHALGIVHRDLKPANLFCSQRSDGQFSIKVLDFGISKIMTPGAPGHDMTKTSALMGSPFYMSPEQMRLSKSVDARADIWSLGVILFELLTGRPPFNAQALTELAIKVAQEPAPPLRALRFDAPEGLERVIAKCLEKDRSKRFQTVGELVLAMSEFGPKHAQISVDRVLGTLRRAGISGASLLDSGDVGEVSSPTQRNERQKVASWGRTGIGAKKRRNLLIGASLAAALGAATAGIVFAARKGSDTRAVVATETNPSVAFAAAAPPPAPASSASTAAPNSSATPATVSVADLPLAAALSAEPKPARNRVAPARAPNSAVPSSAPPSPAPSAKPAYNPLEHL